MPLSENEEAARVREALGCPFCHRGHDDSICCEERRAASRAVFELAGICTVCGCNHAEPGVAERCAAYESKLIAMLRKNFGRDEPPTLD